jgi:hypothetical protein
MENLFLIWKLVPGCTTLILWILEKFTKLFEQVGSQNAKDKKQNRKISQQKKGTTANWANPGQNNPGQPNRLSPQHPPPSPFYFSFISFLPLTGGTHLSRPSLTSSPPPPQLPHDLVTTRLLLKADLLCICAIPWISR